MARSPILPPHAPSQCEARARQPGAQLFPQVLKTHLEPSESPSRHRLPMSFSRSYFRRAAQASAPFLVRARHHGGVTGSFCFAGGGGGLATPPATLPQPSVIINSEGSCLLKRSRLTTFYTGA